jgi:bifunctional enzyme CysN/CysC
MTDSANKPVWHEPQVSREQLWGAHKFHGMTIWLTGLSGSGKSTIAHELARKLTELGKFAYVLDADNVRHGLNSNLGFTNDDRAENVRRMAEVAKLFATAGAITIVPIISPFASGRQFARLIHSTDNLDFIEVHVATSLEDCEQRDTKGLYAQVKAGVNIGLSGVNAPYEAPTAPEFVLCANGESVDQCVDVLLRDVMLRCDLKR